MKVVSSRRVLASAAALAVAGLSGSVYAAAPTVDGTLDTTVYGSPTSVQTIGTQFGDNQSELDAAYVRISGGKMYLLLTGNLESNYNKMEVFFDTKAGGQNVIRGDNPTVDFGNSGNLAGMKFDAGFAPDFYITYARDLNNVYVNFVELATNGGGMGGYLGQITTGTTNAPVSGTVTGTSPLPSLTIGYNDSNTVGVAGSTSLDGNGTTAFTGSEIAIDLSALGITGDFKIAAMINGGNHDFISNQILGGLPDTYGNLGWPGTRDFTGDAGDQFFNVDYINAASEGWAVNSTGDWSGNTNWARGTAPTTSSDAALFGSAITAATTVTVDVAQTVSAMYFNNTNSYTVAGTSAITLDTVAGNAAVRVLAGSHTISAPLAMNKNTTVTVDNAADTLTVTALQDSTNSLTKNGAGTLTVNTVHAAGLTVNAGTVKIAQSVGDDTRGAASSVVKVTNLTIGATAKLDLTNNGVIIPATGTLNGSTISVDTLRAAIIAGRGGVGTGAATWSGAGGIGTSLFAFDETYDSIGYVWTGDPNLLVPPTDLNGLTYDSGDYLVKYCAGADADLNGLVDDTDVAVIGLTYDNGASTGHHWYEGDFNYDGVIDDSDVAILGLAYNPGGTALSPSFMAALSAEYGASFASAFAAGAAGTVVPEPTSLGLLAVGAMGLLRRRRK